jgi:hypothetical protein
MRLRGLFALLALALALAVVGVGCGSGDDGGGGSAGGSGSSESESGGSESESGGGESGDGSGESEEESDGDSVAESSISKKQYVKQAEAVCKENDEQLQADFATFVRENENAKDKSVYGVLVEEVIAPNLQAELEDLQELEVPEGSASRIEAILGAREESIEIAEEDPEAVIQNPEKVFGKASKLAGEYGLAGCANR